MSWVFQQQRFHSCWTVRIKTDGWARMCQKNSGKSCWAELCTQQFGQGIENGSFQIDWFDYSGYLKCFFGTLALHIQNLAEQMGYTVIIGNTNEDPREMLRMITFLNSRQVDGLIITPTEGGEFMVKALLEQEKPLVIGRQNVIPIFMQPRWWSIIWNLLPFNPAVIEKGMQ